MCIKRVQKELDHGTRKCPCGVDCSETDYEVSMSASVWPAEKFTVKIDVKGLFSC